MACTRPMPAAGGPGVRPYFLKRSEAHRASIELPCGWCPGCRIDQARDWSIRCTHEAAMHKHNAFVTLTFSDEGLADRELKEGLNPHTLSKRDWQLFAKRMREKVGPFRFLMSAEYGEPPNGTSRGYRPHYHALIFGQDFHEDRVRCVDRAGTTFFQSPTLAELWPRGRHDIRACIPETISYVCRYVQKKLRKRNEPETRWQRVNATTGECFEVLPEFALMSRGGRGKDGQNLKGIGHGWWEKYKGDAFPSDFVIIKGKRQPVPKYYYNKLKEENPELATLVRDERVKSAADHAADNTPERRQVREELTVRKLRAAKKGTI